jgi:glutamate-1-semialdehyde aminotransferase
MSENYHIGKGQDLYVKARKRIPGGTQLLSKRPEMFLPEQWPSYYTKAHGCFCWDMNGRRLIDFGIAGIGACSLGFADADVNAAAIAAIQAGGMCTLNAPDEMELADLLCELHPWADMARYARSGGEIMAIAVRIARAHTGRDKVAICGYHGWSDWYLAANLAADSALDGHLLPGLSPAGVPRGLSGSALTFRYNDIATLERILAEHPGEFAAIVMEPIRSDEPVDGFLQKVRALADKNGAVLIFDEITSGWRFTLGGAHLSMNVTPDIAVFAKSISNGFPMAAVIGGRDVMESAQNSFISSTYWTEAVGPAAALATIKKMRRVNLPEQLARAGVAVQAGWRELAEKHSLKMRVAGRPALGHFTLDYDEQTPALTTLFTQEMLDRGYLAKPAFYATLAHTDELVADYLGAVDGAFAAMADAVKKRDAAARLRGPVAHGGFRRLT